jgi:hypothetical protein
MPIEFACPCGKAFKVADEYAGKRSKCTACGQPVVVPTPPAPEESAEDAALRALTEGDDLEPAPRTTGGYAGGGNDYAGSAPRRADPPPPPREDAGSHAARALAGSTSASKPKASKPTKSYSGSSYDRPPSRGWSPNWAKVGGGALGVLLGGGLLIGGLAFGRFFIWSPIIIIVGLFGVINGFLSRSGDA